jgi:hypothetical protein
MEAKLRSMEARLRLDASAVGGLPAQVTEQKPDGSVTFRFGHPLPSHTDLDQPVAVNSKLVKK